MNEKKKTGNSESKRKMGSLSEVLGREKCRRIEVPTSAELEKDGKKRGKSVVEELEEKKSKNAHRKPKRSGVTEESKKELTLAEMKVEALKRKMKGKENGKKKVLIIEEGVVAKEKEKEKKKKVQIREEGVVEKEKEKEKEKKKKVQIREEGVVEKEKEKEKKKKVQIREEGVVAKEKEKQKRRLMLVNNRDMEVMTVEDSDFFDFDEDRVERSFKKGQVWAIYDDDDGMPRHYGLIDEVVSLTPFEVRMSWLDLQKDGDGRLTSWEKMGFHISCGRFEVARKDNTDLLNIFSHVVDCERAARKLYRIYPKKGSIWALYNEGALDVRGRDSLSRDTRCYDIVVCLTSYSEMHGLSMAYLEKVDGFRAVFKRREIGGHAIKWLDKDDFRLFSHQIPAKKLSGEEAPHLSGDCWELDPASLPSDLLTVS